MKREILLINARLVKKKDDTLSTIITYQCKPESSSDRFKGNLVFEEWIDGNLLDKFTSNVFSKPLLATFGIEPTYNNRQKIVLSSIDGIL